MNQIIRLDQATANSIAAGEVVERPVSIVKELVENALDARASIIQVAIENGGIRRIQVVDNGQGMGFDDAALAFGRHSTSKLTSIEDLDHLSTMGFRGEALASIAAVSSVVLQTRQQGKGEGTRVHIQAGQVLAHEPCGCPEGTRITVEDLFFNVPARFKFLKKDSTEAGHISSLLERLALARPDVSFRLTQDGSDRLHTPGNNDLSSTVYAVYGKQTALASIPVSETDPPLSISGLVGRPELARSNRAQQSFYVNGRLIRSSVLSAALDEAYKSQLMKNKHAVAFLFLSLPPNLVDINVHPQKMEVRFWNDQQVFRSVYRTIYTALHAEAGLAQPPQETQLVSEGQAPEKPEPVQALVTDPLPLYDRTDPAPSAAADRLAPVPAQADHAGGEQLSVLRIQELADARVIGTLFKTYLVLEGEGDLLLIDQHAAHEKIVYERLLDRHRKRQATQALLTQDLLVPQVVELSRQEAGQVQDLLADLAGLGFHCTLVGPTSVAIRSIPDTGDRSLQPEAAFRMALEALTGPGLGGEEANTALYERMACHAAVKARDSLSEAEIDSLLAELQRLSDPYRCPHGRPVLVRLSRRDLEKMFRRIV